MINLIFQAQTTLNSKTLKGRTLTSKNKTINKSTIYFTVKKKFPFIYNIYLFY